MHHDDTTDHEPKQLTLFSDNAILDGLDIRVRRTIINGEEYVSALDLLQYHGNKINPSLSWKRTLAFMRDKQGADLGSNKLLEHHFEGKGQRKTPVINFKAFLRFAQSAEVPEWEFIRELQMQAAEEKITSKRQRQMEQDIAKHDRAGLGDRPEIVLVKARLENKIGHDALIEIVSILCDKPNWGQLNNSIYQGLFGMAASELREILNTKAIRDKLPLRQIQALTLAEGVLSDMLAVQKELTMKRIIDCIDIAIVPIGEYLKWYSQTIGIHHVTSQSLLRA